MTVAPWFLCNTIARMGYRKGGPVQTAAKEGIFCGRHIAFGNNVSESKNKTRRSFRPNIGWKNVWFDTLKQRLRIRYSSHALRNVKKYGGIENLIVNKPRLVRDSETAMILRENILLRRKLTERYAVTKLHNITEEPHRYSNMLERKRKILRRLTPGSWK